MGPLVRHCYYSDTTSWRYHFICKAIARKGSSVEVKGNVWIFWFSPKDSPHSLFAQVFLNNFILWLVIDGDVCKGHRWVFETFHFFLYKNMKWYFMFSEKHEHCLAAKMTSMVFKNVTWWWWIIFCILCISHNAFWLEDKLKQAFWLGVWLYKLNKNDI